MMSAVQKQRRGLGQLVVVVSQTAIPMQATRRLAVCAAAVADRAEVARRWRQRRLHEGTPLGIETIAWTHTSSVQIVEQGRNTDASLKSIQSTKETILMCYFAILINLMILILSITIDFKNGSSKLSGRLFESDCHGITCYR